MDMQIGILFKKYSTEKKRYNMSYTKVKPKGFGTLPIKILINIFKYIDNHSLLKTMSLVCRHWRHAVRQPEFMKTLRIKGNAISLSYIYDHLRRFKQLQALHLDKVSNPLAILLQASKFSKDLKRISMINYEYLELRIFNYVRDMFPKLEMVNLENTILAIPKYTLIAELTNLKSINLTNISNINMRIILETILNCRQLEEIKISLLPPNVDLRDDDACLIIANTAANLKSLSIDSRSLTNRTYEKLTECPNLSKLFLHYSLNLTYEMVKDFLKNLPNICEFGFCQNFIVTGNNVCSLVKENETIFNNITVLDFTSCILLSDIGIEAIAKHCPNLENIKLKSCRTVCSVEPICYSCMRLIILDVSFCKNLKPSFTVRKQLEKLIIHDCEEMIDFVQHLEEMVDLKVYIALSEYNDDFERI